MRYRLTNRWVVVGLLAGRCGIAHAGVPMQPCAAALGTTRDSSLRESSASVPLGLDSTLYLGKDARGESRLLVTFDLRGQLVPGATVQSAFLALTSNDTTVPATTLEVRDLDTHWLEDTATWDTPPPLGDSYGVQTIASPDAQLRIDVTTAVVHALTSDNAVDLALLPASSGSFLRTFHSREDGPGDLGPRLVVRCANPVVAPGVDETAADLSQLAAVERLRGAATQVSDIQIDRGALQFADFVLQRPGSIGADGTTMARDFLVDYHDLIRLASPVDELQVVRRSADDQQIVFRQRHDGIPVYGAELGVYLRGSAVNGVIGRYRPGIAVSSTPRLPASQAEALAMLAIRNGAQPTGDTQLRYLDRGLLGFHETGTYLTWMVNTVGRSGHHTLFVDANDGTVRYERPNLATYDLDLEDGDRDTPDSLCDVFENNNISADELPPDSNAAAAYMRDTFDWWLHTFKRNSYDGKGEQMEVDINVGFPFPNASYNQGCDVFMFSPGYPLALDVVAHEFTHAVVHKTVPLEYVNQSGAINESLADVFGFMLDQDDYWHGEDLPYPTSCSGGAPGGTNRSLADPTLCAQPDYAANLVTVCPTSDGKNDSGCVHTNSGINNKAAYLIIRGGGTTVNGFPYLGKIGIGAGKAALLYYRLLLLERITSTAQLVDLANAAIKEAEIGSSDGSGDFAGEDDICVVRNAYAGVGLTTADDDCDGIAAPPDDPEDDHVPNPKDNCPTVKNPGQGDTDGDGLGDPCDLDKDGDGLADTSDNCRYAANADQTDTNGDGKGDACQDSDTDFVVDAADNCLGVANQDQRDTDADGQGDACDDDIDADGIANAGDNCPTVANPDQASADGDAIGDKCDTCPSVKSDDNTDTDHDGAGDPCDSDQDNDGIANAADNCPLVVNVHQEDFNHDGVGTACDPAEQEVLDETMHRLNQQFAGDSAFHIRLPSPQCPNCGGELPNNYDSVVDIQLPFEFEARIVDSLGDTLTKTLRQTRTGGQLKFQPAPYTAVAAVGIGSAAQTQGAASAVPELRADQTRYYLEIIPTGRIDPAVAYPLTLTMTDHVQPLCGGDCNGDASVSIDELVRMVGIALDANGSQTCLAGDGNRDDAVTINELIGAVNDGLVGCPA